MQVIPSPFFISAVLLFVPLYFATHWDLKSRTVPLKVWGWSLAAFPTSFLGWYQWYFSQLFDPRIFLLIIAFSAVFFIAGIMWSTGHPSIGGSDIIAILILMFFVPVLPEISSQLFYVFLVLFCSMFLVLAWSFYGKPAPFLVPFTVSHAVLVSVAGLIQISLYT